MRSPTTPREDTRQLLALLALREAIEPPETPVGLVFLRRGDVDFLAVLDARIAALRAEMEATR